jgi:hypothetical protein
MAIEGYTMPMMSNGDVFQAVTAFLRQHLPRWGLRSICVSDVVETRTSSSFKSDLTLGECCCDPAGFAFAATLEQRHRTRYPIRVLLILPSTDGSLLVASDKRTVATRVFCVLEKGTVTPVRTSEPVLLDGLSQYFAADCSRLAGLEETYFNFDRVIELTGNKLATKEVFSKAGVLVPKQFTLERPYGKVREKFQRLIGKSVTKEVVVKANAGNRGEHIKMFGAKALEHAEVYCHSLEERGCDVFVEERIVPLPLRSRGGQRLDWNVRALITLSAKPRWIDGIVRHKLWSDRPVNISQGARLAELGPVLKSVGGSLDQVKAQCCKAAAAIFSRVQSGGHAVAGYLGLDLMVADRGIVFLEANATRVGGWDLLCELRQGPSTAVRTSLLRYFGPLLAANHANRRRVSGYSQLPECALDHFQIGSALISLGSYERAIDCLAAALHGDASLIEAQVNIGYALCESHKPRLAVAAYTKALELGPSHGSARTARWGLFRTYLVLTEFKKLKSIALDMLRCYPDLPDGLRAIALYHLAKGDNEEARANSAKYVAAVSDLEI